MGTRVDGTSVTWGVVVVGRGLEVTGIVESSGTDVSATVDVVVVSGLIDTEPRWSEDDVVDARPAETGLVVVEASVVAEESVTGSVV